MTLAPSVSTSTTAGPPEDVPFARRHVGTSPAEQSEMLALLGRASLADLIEEAVPGSILTRRQLHVPPAASEAQVLAELVELAGLNRAGVSLVGMGFHGTITPPVIRRNVLESPAWYTAYTPYQAEISQGRLEALLSFQTMVTDLTAMDIANASLLDEASAAAEAMLLCRRVSRSSSDRFVVDADCHPATLAVLATRAAPLRIDLAVCGDPAGLGGKEAFGVLLAYPGSSGEVRELGPEVDRAHELGAMAAVSADLLALTLLTPPGEAGADVVVGTTQRFGVPMWFGGPHAAFLATRSEHHRQLPGRLVGVSVDAEGRRALRLALQTREQHIRRERATSNICTAQVLLAVVAGLYALWHGPEGLQAIATRVHGLACAAAEALREGGVELASERFFDTITALAPGRAAEVVAAARRGDVDLRLVDPDRVAFSFDETTTAELVSTVLQAFGVDASPQSVAERAPGDSAPGGAAPSGIPEGQRRRSAFLQHPVFHLYRSETEMLRYLRRLSDRDLALDRSMIPLGSCTMKLNGTTEMTPVTWPSLADVHPFGPPERSGGYRRIVTDLQEWLAEITGYAAVSLQPNAGSQGELAGLLAIRRYHEDRGEERRDVCLIPSSAHGTNAASAALAGMRVVVVDCDERGDVDLDDLAAKTIAHADRLAAAMITYPSTHGVFEAGVTEVCEMVHAAGGQVYLDGANLNALVGLARPADIGADVSHLNLHKTFCVPHGGGGPGVGPVGVRAHLARFLPSHPLAPDSGPAGGIGPLTSAPWGSPGVLAIPWAYVRLMGPDGLAHATEAAILAANYVAARLAPAFPILYRGPGGTVAHECVLDLRPLTARTGVTAEDVAKRLIDHGFHAPTMSFPVAGTLMVEPTESEAKVELDRFCDAMLAIRDEMAAVEAGEIALADSPLRRAPHTAHAVLGEGWDRPYTRAEGALPPGVVASDKYWPPVARIDNAYGDRNLQCSCPPVVAYA
ncbi:MAG: aminomethyl-transferring glycine dehydrogenase [Acidimicrobiales bacterium]